ncbi:MAG: hypothetical protein AB1750_07570, partial [Chloroflexota bacterium]
AIAAICGIIIQRIPTAPTATLPPPAPTYINAQTSPSNSECQVEIVDGIFQRIVTQNPSLEIALGAKMMPEPSCIWSSHQLFEGGEMIWRADILYPTDIYVLFSSGQLDAFKSNYKSGSPLQSCSIGTPTKDRLQPILGFGKVWCDNQQVKRELGYAISEEKALYRGIQTFENGWLILINNDVYALIETEKKWESVRAFEYKTISLRAQSELLSPEANLGLGQGTVTLPKDPIQILDPFSGMPLAVPFDMGWKSTTQCGYLPNRPAAIHVDTNVPRPRSLYLLVQAGWGTKEYEGNYIGKVALELTDDTNIETPLILGNNIRDWADRSNAVTEKTSPNLWTAWTGFDPNGIPGRMDILIIDVPSVYWLLTVKSVQIVDESVNSVNNMNPCIHLLAVTVKYSP